MSEIVNLSLVDRIKATDKSKLKTKIKFYVPGTDILLWEGHNKVILPGAEFLAFSLFDLGSYGYSQLTPTYNTSLNLDNTLYVDPLNTQKTCLFCVGTDGCGTENADVYEEDFGKWILPANVVPFQYVPLTDDITNTQRADTYFGRKTLNNYYAYYFKSFSADPTYVRQYTDGTAIDDTVYTSTNTTPIEVYVELHMKITKDDCRDYFIETTGINDARINTISLCTAWYKEYDGYKYYENIRPVTKLNFPNECLIDLNKGIDIVYQIYF